MKNDRNDRQEKIILFPVKMIYSNLVELNENLIHMKKYLKFNLLIYFHFNT